MLHIKIGSASGKQLRSFSLSRSPPDYRDIKTSFPAISAPGDSREVEVNVRQKSKSG